MYSKWSGLFNMNKLREEDESYVPRKDKKSKFEAKYAKFIFCNEDNSDSYKGLANIDDAGEGPEVSISEKINNDKSLDACKGPPKLEVGKILAAESSPESEDSGSEA